MKPAPAEPAKKAFQPFIPADQSPTEMTWRGMIIGLLIAVVFGAGNAYLGLKVGMTISASIPAAVISMAILRSMKGSSILENNIVQTVGSSGESLAAGVIFTIPALFFLGDHPSSLKIFWISSLGGLLGVLFMIPLRRYLIVQEHETLPFPEGKACAEILIAGEEGGSKARLVVWGGAVGAAFKFLMSGAHAWVDTASWTLTRLQGTVVSLEATPSLLGVGFIIGPRIAAMMLSGAALGWWVLIPLIKMFGEGLAAPIFPAAAPIGELAASKIWSNYIRYIGAGAVATGGLVGLIKSIPIVSRSFRAGLKEAFGGVGAKVAALRTDDDLPMSWVVWGSVAIILALWLTPGMNLNLMAIALVIVMGFFFVTVASLSVGLVGSSSNPVSGMTITTLLVTCLVFVGFGWTSESHMLGAMMVGAVVCIAICMAGDASQDLKTGYLVGATPRLQQLSEVLGVLVPATVMGGTLFLLDKAYGLGSDKLSAPQATLMSLVVKGVLHGDLPWLLVITGAVIGACVELLGIGCLPFAIGLYLPVSLSTPIMAGGLVMAAVQKLAGARAEAANQRGVLLASGLVAGDAVMGVVIALLVVTGLVNVDAAPLAGSGAALAAFAAVAVWLGALSLRK